VSLKDIEDILDVTLKGVEAAVGTYGVVQTQRASDAIERDRQRSARITQQLDQDRLMLERRLGELKIASTVATNRQKQMTDMLTNFVTAVGVPSAQGYADTTRQVSADGAGGVREANSSAIPLILFAAMALT